MLNENPRPLVVAVIQARLASQRLPRKVLEVIGDVSVIEHVVRRVQSAKHVDRVVVATTTDCSDDELVRFLEQRNIEVFRGSVSNVLERFWNVATNTHPDVLVRVTGDSPLLDPTLIDSCIEALLMGHFDYVSTRTPTIRTYPRGVDTEVFSFDALKIGWKLATQDYQKEHVTPVFYDDTYSFRTTVLHNKVDYSDFRVTLDTPEDLEVIRKVFSELPPNSFSWVQIVKILAKHPEWKKLNEGVVQKSYLEVDTRKF